MSSWLATGCTHIWSNVILGMSVFSGDFNIGLGRLSKKTALPNGRWVGLIPSVKGLNRTERILGQKEFLWPGCLPIGHMFLSPPEYKDTIPSPGSQAFDLEL